METISERITRIQKEKKISQTAIGAAWGVTQQGAGKILNKEDEDYTLGNIKKIADVLDVPVSHLIFSRAELETLNGSDPLISPIVAEVSRIAALPDREQSDTYLSVLLASARAMK